MKSKLALIIIAALLVGAGSGFAFLAMADIPVNSTTVTKTIPNERFLP